MAAIGFIGASGLMGHGMAKNLLAKGHALSLTVHRNRERVADLLAAGAVEKQPAGRARRGERDRLSLRHRLAAGRGLGRRAARACSPARGPGLVIVDCSTSEPDSTARLRERRGAGRRRPRRRAARAHADRGRGRQAQRHGRRRRRDLRPARAGAARLRRERLPRRRPGRRPHRQAAQQLHRPGDLHRDRGSVRGRPARRHRPAAAGRHRLGRRRQLGPLPDDGEDAARRSRRAQASSSTTRARTCATTPTSPRAWRSRRSSARRCTSRWCIASALGHGKKFVPSLVEAQEQLTGAKLVP